MALRDFLVWTVISLYGLGLLFDPALRNHFFEAFSYAFNRSTPRTQEVADLVRLVLSLAMSIAFAGLMFRSVALKFLALISLVAHSVLCQVPYILGQLKIWQDTQNAYQLAVSVVMIILAMISLIDQLVEKYSSEGSKKQTIQQQGRANPRNEDETKTDVLQEQREQLSRKGKKLAN